MIRVIVDSSKVPCPVCFSPAGFPCSAPTNDGRRDVKWFHLDRTFENAANG